MKASGLRLCALFVGGVTIAACSQTTELSRYTPSGATIPDRGSPLTYSVLHSFSGPPDGSAPFAGLTNVGGTLYGTTPFGGAYDAEGSVFSITTGGSEKVLYSFGKRGDGAYPYAGLIDVGGTLYGTTWGGGKYGEGDGTIFSVTTGGNEKVLYNFGKGTDDGMNPYAGLIHVGGVFYGTTYNGGKYNGGTVFSVTLAGSEKVLHSFGSGTDGGDPRASLIDAGGTLYGTTLLGGAYKGGTVFNITTTGKEKVLHSFGNGTDGDAPEAALVEQGDALWGTTYQGGTRNYGAVFFIEDYRGSAKEKVLYSFGGGNDGRGPDGALLPLGTALYGNKPRGCVLPRRFRGLRNGLHYPGEQSGESAAQLRQGNR